jgi:hypothetical protein
MPKLTKRTVDALAADTKDYSVWDTLIAGFGVRIMPSGAKIYQAQYRKGGRTRRIARGRHGNITVEEARLLAKEVLGDVAKGENPAEDIAQHRKAPTVAALSRRRRLSRLLAGPKSRQLDRLSIPKRKRFGLIDRGPTSQFFVVCSGGEPLFGAVPSGALPLRAPDRHINRGFVKYVPRGRFCYEHRFNHIDKGFEGSCP